MSKTVYNAACGCNLRHPAKAVLKEMAWFADDEGEEIWPSVLTLAGRTGLTRRAVQKLLRELEEVGAIQAVGSRLGGRRKTTHYRMNLDWLKARTKTANSSRPFPPQDTDKKRNGERQNNETANKSAENSELRSPEHKEHENEKKQEVPSIKTRRPQATSYEHQRLRQKIRTVSSRKSVPSPLSPAQLEIRRVELRRQAEEVARKCTGGEVPVRVLDADAVVEAGSQAAS